MATIRAGDCARRVRIHVFSTAGLDAVQRNKLLKNNYFSTDRRNDAAAGVFSIYTPKRKNQMRRFRSTAVTAGLIGSAMLLAATVPASTATLAGATFAAPSNTAMAEQVHSRNDHHRYDSNQHGQRYRQARPGFRHHHDGYYYSSAWWTVSNAVERGLGVPGAVFRQMFR